MKKRLTVRNLLRVDMVLVMALIMPTVAWADCLPLENLTANDVTDHTVTLPFTEDFNRQKLSLSGGMGHNISSLHELTALRRLR